MDDDQILTTDELAKVRNCSPSRMNKERMVGGGPPYIKDGGAVRYRWGDYKKWLAKQTRHAGHF